MKLAKSWPNKAARMDIVNARTASGFTGAAVVNLIPEGRFAGAAIVNLLTLSRIAAAIGFLAFVLEGSPRIALLMLAGVYVSDILDGFLARKWKATTRFGACFDLVSDIFFVLLSYQALVIAGSLPMWILPAAMIKFAGFIATSYILSGRGAKSGGDKSGAECISEATAEAASVAAGSAAEVAAGENETNRIMSEGGAKDGAEADRGILSRFKPVFDRIGRLSGILYMCIPAAVMILKRFDSYMDMTVPIALISLSVCLLAAVSSVHRIGRCVLAVRSRGERFTARSLQL